MEITAGINGCGRFALNLLWRWLNDPSRMYHIAYINDKHLTAQQIVDCMREDRFLTGFQKWKIDLTATSTIVFTSLEGSTFEAKVTHAPAEDIPWIGEPVLFFECSGELSGTANLTRPFLKGNTRHVVVSATCYDADVTLVYGFNHREFNTANHQVISYGSCTVNPGVVLLNFLNTTYGVKHCVFNVVHNVQSHRLVREGSTLQRKVCTFEVMAPRLLPFINRDNLVVPYTVVPWDGPSALDFVIQVDRPITSDHLLSTLRAGVGNAGELHGLIGLTQRDMGPLPHSGTQYSAVFVEDKVSVRGRTMHLFGYFDTEASANRYHDLANHIAKSM